MPNETLGPRSALDAINLPLTEPIVDARYLDPPGSNPRRVSARFSRGDYTGYIFTYSIDRAARIVAVSNLNHSYSDFGDTLNFVYGPNPRTIVAPSDGVQRLSPGENLYPTTTTPTS